MGKTLREVMVSTGFDPDETVKLMSWLVEQQVPCTLPPSAGDEMILMGHAIMEASNTLPGDDPKRALARKYGGLLTVTGQLLWANGATAIIKTVELPEAKR